MNKRALKAALARERRKHEQALRFSLLAVARGAAQSIADGRKRRDAVTPLAFEAVIAKHDARVARQEATWPMRASVRKALYQRDNNRCYYCGSSEWLTLDHKVPQSVGGSNHSSNLVTACKYCNSAKGPKSVDAFIRHRFGGGAA